MTIPVPNATTQLINPQSGTATAFFQKFLAQVLAAGPISIPGRVDTLETDVAANTADIAALTVSLAALSATVTTHSTHLGLLPASRLTGSAAYDPPNILAAGTTTTTVAVTGAVLGQSAEANFSLDITGLVITAYVSAADTVTVVLYNPTAGAINIANGTLKVQVWTP